MPIINCKNCSKEKFYKPSRLKLGEGKYCSLPCYWKLKRGKSRSPEAIIKFRISMKGKFSGDKNPMWKGGVTPVHYRIRNSNQYKEWRTKVFERDNYTCVFCNVRNGNGKAIILQADHIKPFSLFPKLRFAIDNGRTLCVPCHKKTPTFGVRVNKYQLANA